MVFALVGGEAQGDAGARAAVLDCANRKLVDYERPLRRMRPIPRIPDSNRVPFGPRGLRLSRSSAPVFVGPDTVGFQITNASTENTKRWQGWVATSALFTVNGTGKTLQQVRSRRQSLRDLFRGRIENLGLGSFRVSALPQYYRLEVLFQHQGKVAGRYAEYLRVLPQRVDVRLGLRDTTVQPGQHLVWRVENYGTTIVEFGLSFKVERYTPDGWVIDPITPAGFPQIGFYIGAGIAGRCESLSLPIDMEPGRYRLTKDVFAAGNRDIKRTFDVVP